jgi:hypothetical protein
LKLTKKYKINENYIINEAKNNNVLNGNNLSATGFSYKFKLKDINVKMVCFFTN